jgi:tetratricopeptide (TPR) repeat protein
MLGDFLACDCGAMIVVPAGIAPPGQTNGQAAAPAVPDAQADQAKQPEAALPRQVLAPTPVSMRTECRGKSVRRKGLMVSLTPGAVWIQDTWRLRSLVLKDFVVEKRSSRKEIGLSLLVAESPGEVLVLKFANAAEAKRWSDKILEWQAKQDPDAPSANAPVPEGVALVRRAPDVPHVVLGPVSFLHGTLQTADRGLQLRGGIRGADAVIELKRKKCSEMGFGARQVSGLAVRAEDADAAKRLRWTWYAEETGTLANRMLVLVLAEAILLFLGVAFLPGKSPLFAATGESGLESIVSASAGVGVFFAWPLLLIVLLRILRWRELLRTVGIAVLAVITLRGLVVELTHLLVVVTSGAGPAQSKIWILADPVDWAFMIAGVVLCKRAWQLYSRSREMLPEEALVASVPRKIWSRGLLAVTVVFLVSELGFAAMSRHEESTHLVQAGVDPIREHEARLALNEGADFADKGNLGQADEAFQRSLRLWETLAAGGSSPPIYRANLAITLTNLGWVRVQQARYDEAETYYARAVTLADRLKGDPHLDADVKRSLDRPREALATLREQRSAVHEQANIKLLNQKSKEAYQKYEEAAVKDDKGDPEAQRLYREAITLWEEVLPQATDEMYRKHAPAQLLEAYLRLGDLQRSRDDHNAAEASFKKAIDYGETAVARDPSRPLPKHNLSVARQRLELLRNQTFRVEIDKLQRASRFADSFALFSREIEGLERRVREGKELDLAVPSLASRLNGFAWFLAHCPDGHVRDTNAAVAHARRAAELRPSEEDCWYTLALAQYRNGDWRDSIATLEKLKAIMGEFGATEWLVSCMNLHQLGRKEEARTALRKARQWIEEQTRKAETDLRLRVEFELARPAIDSLLEEATRLLGGEPRVG